MFTRYKGIEIPQNYSGSRFKSDAPPTETKTHKPSASFATKTSISPSFENVLRQGENEELDTNYQNELVSSQDFYEDENYPSEEIIVPSEMPKESQIEEKSLFNEFKPLVSRIIKNVDSEDLLLISLVILLMNEENEGAGELILPLLLLLLYR